MITEPYILTAMMECPVFSCLQLKDAAVQHREVQGNESKLFRSYFGRIVTWKGGYVCWLVFIFCSVDVIVSCM